MNSKKYVKTFEQFFLNEADAAIKAPDSKVYVDDVTIDSGKNIKAAEILGAITASATEEDFKDYFYQHYGNMSFTEGEMAKLVNYYNQYKEEENQEETDKEQKEKESGSSEQDGKDVTAGLGGL